MSTKVEIQPQNDRELVICRILDIPVEQAFRGWSEPKLLQQWFAPNPWTISKVEREFKSGGSAMITMRSPDGQDIPMPGIYLEVIPNKKIVFTDAFTKAWEPSNNAFMVATVEFEDAGNGKTKYTARSQHWTKEALEQHKQMGFEAGWGQTIDQLEALMKSL